MNADRRKAIEAIRARIDVHAGEVADLQVEVDTLKEEIEGLQEDEQNYFDNMPESFQQGDKGDAAQSAIDKLCEAVDALLELDAALGDHSDSFATINEALSEAAQ